MTCHPQATDKKVLRLSVWVPISDQKSLIGKKYSCQFHWLCLGPKKSLSSPRLELMAQGMAQRTKDESRVKMAPC